MWHLIPTTPLFFLSFILFPPHQSELLLLSPTDTWLPPFPLFPLFLLFSSLPHSLVKSPPAGHHRRHMSAITTHQPNELFCLKQPPLMRCWWVRIAGKTEMHLHGFPIIVCCPFVFSNPHGHFWNPYFKTFPAVPNLLMKVVEKLTHFSCNWTFTIKSEPNGVLFWSKNLKFVLVTKNTFQ